MSAPVSLSQGRQAVWDAVRSLKEFTSTQLAQRAYPTSVHVVSDYRLCLLRGGYIAITDEAKGQKQYALVKDVGFIAPRLNKKGEILPDNKQLLMWRAMKILKNFTACELALFASTKEQTVSAVAAMDYLKHLRVAGYVCADGAQGEKYSYKFVKNTGGHAPMVQRTKVLYDPNLGKVVCLEPLED